MSSKQILKILIFVIALVFLSAQPRGIAYCATCETILKIPFSYSLSYESRFNLIDDGSSTGRHGLFNFLWFDLNREDTTGVGVNLKGRALDFSGDTFVKQFNDINNVDTFSFNEAYLYKNGGVSAFKLGLFKYYEKSDRLFEIGDFVNEFDLMNKIKDRRGDGNLWYKRRVSKEVDFFLDYETNVDYSNSLKIAGVTFKNAKIAAAFNEIRSFYTFDCFHPVSKKIDLFASYRKNMFNYLDPINQYSMGANYKIEPFGRLNGIIRLTGAGLEFLRNETTNSYFLLKRNLSDLQSSNVIFSYQKDVIGLKLSAKLRDALNTGLELRAYQSLSSLFGEAEGLSAPVPKMRIIKLSAMSHYKKMNFETALLKRFNKDGSTPLDESLNFRLSVLYPF